MNLLRRILHPTSFRARIFRSLAPLFLALFAVVAAVSVQQQRALARDEFRKRGGDIIKSLAYSCELGVLAEDRQLLETSIRSLAGDSDVGFIEIYDVDGRFLTGYGTGDATPLSDADWEVLRSGEDPFPGGRTVGRRFIEFFAPVLSESVVADELLLGVGGASTGQGDRAEAVGFVRVGLSLDPVRKRSAAVLRLWAGLAGLFLLLSLVSTYLFSRRITAPINLLTRQAEEIARGNLEQAIPIESQDEIGRLGATFNEMARSLKINLGERERILGEIQELNQTLEERIRKRTEELEELYRLSASMQEPLSLEEALSRVLEAARCLVGIDRVCVLRLDREGSRLRPLSAAGIPEEEWERVAKLEIAIDPGTGLARVVRDGTALVHDPERGGAIEVPLDRSQARQRIPDCRFLLLPILARGSTIGVLACDNRSSDRPIREDTSETLQTFAAHAASALENAELFQELNDKGREIEAANRHKSEFLANMSHELRTPLNAVIGFSEVLIERMFGELNEKQEEYLNDILASGRHLLSLINDILDLSKVEAGQMDLALTRFDLPSALENAVTLVKERAQRRGIKLQLDVDSSLETLVADERKFKQILLNLLSNAVKFTDPGGGVTLRAAPDGGKVRFSVADDGIGIADTDQDRIFDAFGQAEVNYTRKTEGTGLGLTLSRRMVELHGGEIWVESRPGEGSTFSFTLPVRDLPAPPEAEKAPAGGAAAATAVEPARSVAQAASGRDLILVVEDDARSAELLSVHLRGAGMEVEVARDGERGLELARQLRPRAIVLDILMPRVDGWEFLARIKDDAATASIPVVIVSMLDERGHGLALGATDHLLKPIDPGTLVSAIQRVCRETGGQREIRVLAIDDDARALELTRAILEPQGFELIRCQSGAEGIEIAREQKPDVIVLDLMMPEMDGFEVSRILKHDARTAHIPIVILTSRSLGAVDKRRLAGRITHLARKSEFDRDEFIELLRSAVDPRETDGG